jgi:broad specificity phosphatase PhoE
MQLYFIRHGQSVNNAYSNDPDYIEHPDPFLTETGLAQVEQLAKFLKEKQLVANEPKKNSLNQHGFAFDHIYTSLMERAAHTATPIARALGVPLSVWMDIYEEGGIYAREKENRFQGLPGKPRSYFEKHIPELKLPDGYDESGWWGRPFESEEERQARADRVLVELLERHGDKEGQPEERIVFVSHGGFFMRLLSSMIKLPWRQGAFGMASWFNLHNCSISRIDFRDGEIMFNYINNASHLPAHLITE